MKSRLLCNGADHLMDLTRSGVWNSTKIGLGVFGPNAIGFSVLFWVSRKVRQVTKVQEDE